MTDGTKIYNIGPLGASDETRNPGALNLRTGARVHGTSLFLVGVVERRLECRGRAGPVLNPVMCGLHAKLDPNTHSNPASYSSFRKSVSDAYKLHHIHVPYVAV